MGRPRTAKHPKPAELEPEEEFQDIPDEEPASVIEHEPVAAQPTMSKADACRAALAAGIEKAEEAMEFTLNKFGVEIKATDFTLYKSKAKGAAAAAPAKRGRKPKAVEAAREVSQSPAVPKAFTPANGRADLLDALTAMKPLIAQYGADQVKKMVDLLD
jgi:hypothetical protein